MAKYAAIGDITQGEMSVDKYCMAKIKMLEREFMIPLTADEKKHMFSLETAAAIDRYARTMIQKYLN